MKLTLALTGLGLATLVGATPASAQQTEPTQAIPAPLSRRYIGIVRTQQDQPLAGVHVTLQGTFLTTLTKADGRFVLHIPAKFENPVLILEAPGYTSQTLPLPAEASDQLAAVLGQALTVDIGETTWAASRKEENVLRAPFTISHLTGETLQQSPAININGTLATLKGVDQVSNSLLVSNISTRGFNGTQATRILQLADFVDTQAPSLSNNLGNMMAPAEVDIASIDVLYGPASSLYGINALNGVVLMSSKDAFAYPGVTAQIRGGNRGFMEGQLRYAQRLSERLAFKMVGVYTGAKEWEADNQDAVAKKLDAINNAAGDPRGYNAVNRYGDIGNTFTSGPLAGQTVYMPGWSEKELLDNQKNTYVLMLNPSLAYLINPGLKLTYEYRFAQTDNNFQSLSRYRLVNSQSHLHHVELNGNNWFVRAYTSQDDTKKAFDLPSLGAFMQTHKDPTSPLGLNYAQEYFGTYELMYGRWLQTHTGDIAGAQQAARAAAAPYQLSPGSDTYNVLREQISQDNTPGVGAHLASRSRMSDISAQYLFHLPIADLVVGGAYRYFTLGSPNKDGRFFEEIDGKSSTNYQYGGYAQLTRTLLDRHLRLSAATRVDAFRNFSTVASPRLAAVVSLGEKRQHNFRVSVGQAYSTPSIIYQYAHFDQGQGIFLSNLKGYDGYSLAALAPGNNPTTNTVHLDPLRLERVVSYELGYRASLSERLAVDLSTYYSTYKDLISVQTFVGMTNGQRPTLAQLATLGKADSPVRIIEASYNAAGITHANGFTAEATYTIAKPLIFSANYTLNYLIDAPAETKEFFNSPRHKFNLALRGEITPRLNYATNFRWVQSFYYSSGFAAGQLPTYGTLDAHIGYAFPKSNLLVRLDGTNLFDSNLVQTYGGPRLGRMVSAGIRFGL